jgi:hypothetical protein
VIAPCSLSATAAFLGFRNAAGILDMSGEIQCCRLPPVRQSNKLLTALVKTQDRWCQEMGSSRRAGEYQNEESKKGPGRETQSTLSAGRPRRLDAPDSVDSTGLAVDFSACRDYGDS